MFNKIKDMFGKGAGASDSGMHSDLQNAHAGAEEGVSMSKDALKQVAKFAKEKKLVYADRPGNKGYTLDGQVRGKHYKVERGSPSRQYIEGTELRMRCDLGVAPDASFMVVNRHLKSSLDNNAFSSFTDTMETMVNTNLPEEVLWLTMYGEVGWPELGERFVNDYCILAERRDHAHAVVTHEFMRLLETWPNPRMTKPTLFMLMRGRLYLRMQFDDDSFTLEHAIDAFELLCNSVLDQATLLAQE